MEKTTKVTKSSDLYRKIDELGLPHSQRYTALAAAEKIEWMISAVEFVLRLVRSTPEGLASTQKLRHQ